MEIAQALILAGRGRRDQPWPIAPVGPKHLVPVANRPILFHNLAAARASGIEEATILAEPAAADAIRAAVGRGCEWGLQVRHVTWRPELGLRGALAAGRDFLGDRPVLVQHGDALLRERLDGAFAAFARERLDALALRLYEGAARPLGTPAPGYVLGPRAVEILLEGGTAAASPMAEVRGRGGRVAIERVDGVLPCHGPQDALLDGNRRMLEGLKHFAPSSALDDCTIQGVVHVHESAHVARALLRGPLVIGPGARVIDAYVGPYTSIGGGALIEGTEIEHSIVLAEAQLRFVGARLESSVIGRRARVVRGFEMPGGIRVSLGEAAEVALR
jgi:glucose-1-phosphate thymidylyltransferase